MLNTIWGNITSSILVSAIDAPIFNGVLQFARERAEGNPWWLKLYGQHEALTLDRQLKLLASSAPGLFWHNGTYFIIELSNTKNDNKNTRSGLQPDAFVPRFIDPASYLTVSCFGHTDKPVRKLLRHIEKRVVRGEKLDVIEMQAGAQDKSRQRNKLSLSKVDLNQGLKDEITADIEQFFDKSTQKWYEDSGRPYRHGYLLCGPPGTGKTSLSTALASHCNVPLVIISLQGMNDKQLKEAFSRVPFKSIILLEDIDCAGADVRNRGGQTEAENHGRTQAGPSGVSINMPERPQASVTESMMNRLRDEQNVANYRILSRVSAMEDRLAEYIGNKPDEDHTLRARNRGNTTSDPPPSTSSSVSLSGLLNAIDGANSTEGRLIIMTTNHRERLDPALCRAGRIERKYELGYANKETSFLTFKRLFDNDVLKRYTTDAIDRLAKAFQDQFPSHGKHTTAELSKYFGQYRGRPNKAVEDFADWLKVGDDKFMWLMDYSQSIDEDVVYNVPEPFDRALLQVIASDFVDSETNAVKCTTLEDELEEDASRSVWNTLSWEKCSEDETLPQLQAKVLAITSNFADRMEWASILMVFNKYKPTG